MSSYYVKLSENSDKLLSRTYASSIYKELTDQEIVIDFDGIRFITWSATHEFLCLKDRYTNAQKSVKFINLRSQPKRIFTIVSKHNSSVVKRKEDRLFQIIDKLNDKELEDYLLDTIN